MDTNNQEKKISLADNANLVTYLSILIILFVGFYVAYNGYKVNSYYISRLNGELGDINSRFEKLDLRYLQTDEKNRVAFEKIVDNKINEAKDIRLQNTILLIEIPIVGSLIIWALTSIHKTTSDFKLKKIEMEEKQKKEDADKARERTKNYRDSVEKIRNGFDGLRFKISTDKKSNSDNLILKDGYITSLVDRITTLKEIVFPFIKEYFSKGSSDCKELQTFSNADMSQLCTNIEALEKSLQLCFDEVTVLRERIV